MTAHPKFEHPAPQELAAYADGRLDENARTAITDHLLECAECYEVVAETGTLLNELEPEGVRVEPRPFRRMMFAAAAALVLMVLAYPLARRWTSQNSDPLMALGAAIAERPFEGRIARFEHAPLRERTRGDGKVPLPILAAAGQIEKRMAGRDDAVSLHAVGVANLASRRLDDAVAFLERAALDDARPEHLSDLAAAYLARGAENGDPADFVSSFESAERALKQDPRFAPAAFNRALALEAQPFLTHEAIGAWDAYLAIDSSSPWAEEAVRRRADLRARPRPVSSMDRRRKIEEAVASQRYDEVGRLAAAFPQEARVVTEEVLWPRWARAVIQGRSDDDTHLALGTIADVLSRRGDFWAHDLRVSVDGASVTDRLKVASGIEALDRATAHYRAGRLHEAEREADAASVFLRGSPFDALAQLVRASVRFTRRDPPLPSEAVGDVDASRHPSLAARMEWLSGLNAGVKGRLFESRIALGSAAARLAAIGEKESAAAVRSFAAQALDLLGESDLAWRERLHAAEEMTIAGATPQRWHTTLFVLAEAAQRRGEHGYARLVSTTCLARATAEKRAEWAVDALQIRASAAASLGDAPAASRDVDEAAIWIAGVSDERVREGMRMFLDRAALSIFESSDPGRALRAGEDALGRAAALGDQLRVAEIEWGLARLHRAMGQPGHAERRLRAAAGRIERTRMTIQDEALRMSYADTASGVVDELIDLLVEQERDHEALRALTGRGRGAGNLGLVAPVDGTTLVYAVLEEETILWVVRAGRPAMHRIAVGRERLRWMVEKYRRAFDELGAGDELYRLLVERAARDLAAGERIAIVPDEMLFALPFAALRDPQTGRYLVESRPVKIALHPAEPARRDVGVRSEQALVIGNPAIPVRFRSELPSLAAAEREANAVAAVYPRSRLLLGPEATRRRFLDAAATHRVIHFAGHAKANARDAGASALFFAPEDDDGVMYARELGASSLDGVDVFVLAGCRTAEGKTYALEGMSGLARAALEAGAEHVVATLGEIADEPSAHLFPRFHRMLAAGQEPAEALRAVQIEMIRSRDPRYTRPTAWGLVQVMTAGS